MPNDPPRPAEAWRTWPRDRLDREYSPSSCIPSPDPFLATGAELSRRAAETLEVRRDLRYGDGPDEALDLFPAPYPGGPLEVFFHAGYWQALGKADVLFPAPGFVANGVSYAAVDHTLAPRATLAGIVDQARRSVAWLARNAAWLGFDPGRLFVSGHSAGAHLAVMLLMTDWGAYGLPADTVKGGVLISGVYDVEPLVGTYVNDALGLDAATARALSPRHLLQLDGSIVAPVAAEPRLPVMLPRPRFLADPSLPAVVTWGEVETTEFERQSLEFAAGWATLGHPVDVFEVPGRNHFDLVLDLGDPGTQLGAGAFRQLGLRCG